MADNIDWGDGSDVATPEPGTPRQPAYRGAGVSASLIIGIVLAVLTIILALQNTEKTTVEVFNGDYKAPLIVVILAAVITGVVPRRNHWRLWRHHRRRRLADRAELRRRRNSR